MLCHRNKQAIYLLFYKCFLKYLLPDQLLLQPVLQNIDGLILGCTHYPLIKKQIDQFYKGSVEVIDTSLIVANEIKRILHDEDLMNQGKAVGRQFFVSDYTDSFEKSTQIFFGETIKLTQYPIWD